MNKSNIRVCNYVLKTLVAFYGQESIFKIIHDVTWFFRDAVLYDVYCSCFGMFHYSLMIGNGILIFLNGVGAFSQSLYVVLYLLIARPKVIIPLYFVNSFNSSHFV